MLFQTISTRSARRGLFSLTASFIMLGLGSCSSWDAPRPIVVSGHPDWPPVMFEYRQDIDGVGPALAKKIFADLGIPAKFPATGPWDVVQLKARNGDVDVLVAAYKTTARQEFLVYSDAYIEDPLVVFVKKGHDFAFDKNEDLLGKTGVGTTGDSYGQTFDDYIKTHLKFAWVPTTKEAFDLVAAGQADYFISSLYSGHEELKTERRGEEFVALPHRVSEELFYMAFSKKSPYQYYLPQINRLIEKYKADGTVDQLLAYYKKQFFIEEHQ